MSFTAFTWQAAVAGRWTARILGTLWVLFFLAFVFGEGPPPVMRMPPREQFYLLGICLLFGGLVLAWFREGWGGAIAVCAWALLSVMAGKPVGSWFLGIPAIVGLLHILCWLRLRGTAPAETGTPRLVWYLLPPLGIFVLLCLNEVFGQPPLMTPSRPPIVLAGNWSDENAAFTIAPDGAVSGEVLGQPLSNGRFIGNRSWFGRLMNWRTDYLIRGSAGGRSVTAPMMFQDSELRGSVSVRQGRPQRLRLKKH